MQILICSASAGGGGVGVTPGAAMTAGETGFFIRISNSELQISARDTGALGKGVRDQPPASGALAALLFFNVALFHAS